MGRITKLLQDLLPGTFVHSVQVGKTRSDDHEAGFFGIVNDQVRGARRRRAGAVVQRGYANKEFTFVLARLTSYVSNCPEYRN